MRTIEEIKADIHTETWNQAGNMMELEDKLRKIRALENELHKAEAATKGGGE